MNPTHIVQSGELTEGLFGQILAWVLEILPYLEKHGLRPEWQIFSRNYGSPPGFNIFPEIVKSRYEPDRHDGPSKIISLEQLKSEVGHPVYNFQTDFALANRLFHKHFVFLPEVENEANLFFAPHAGRRILGLHFRGTDKLLDQHYTNPVTYQLLLRAALDLINSRGDIDLVFVASDEASFVKLAQSVLPVPVVSFAQRRRGSDASCSAAEQQPHAPLFRDHDTARNIEVGRCAVIDSLLLSRCDYLLKGQSALSGWSKIWNPDLQVYRIAADKTDWFPDAFIPQYRTADRLLHSELERALEGEMSIEEKSSLSPAVSSYLTAH